MIPADTLASLYAQAAQGVSKEACELVTDDETAAAWDRIVAEMDQMRGKGFTFEVPSTPTLDLEAVGLTVEDVLRLQQKNAARAAQEAPDDEPETDGSDDDPEPDDTEEEVDDDE